jgi:hypothetical protein
MQIGVFEDLRTEPGKQHNFKLNRGFPFIIALGEETYDFVSAELSKVLKEINEISQEKKVTVEGKDIPVELFLSADMKYLCTLLGLYEVFKPGSLYKCPFCAVTQDEFTDLKKYKEWPLRDIQQMRKWGKESMKYADTSNFARLHEGQMVRIDSFPSFHLKLIQKNIYQR